MTSAHQLEDDGAGSAALLDPDRRALAQRNRAAAVGSICARLCFQTAKGGARVLISLEYFRQSAHCAKWLSIALRSSSGNVPVARMKIASRQPRQFFENLFIFVYPLPELGGSFSFCAI